MFFLISKALAFVLTPSNLLMMFGLLGLLLMLFRWRRLGISFIGAAIVGLAVAGWSPLGPVLLMELEERFPKPEMPATITGLVMLGGAVDIHITQARGSEAWNDQAERITAVAELANKFPNARIILSGGAGKPDGINESSITKQALVAMGLSEARLEIETRSRNTCENATQSVVVAAPKAGDVWLLVTSASHMPRAVACFRAANFPVVPYPVDYRTRGAEDMRRVQESAADGLADVDLAAHEWVGLISYRIAGLTHELFPAP
jgi:uncharacterized SAM-binding protein YcdF (DUF218 family)